MIIFTWPVVAPLLLATGAYYLFGLFLSDLNALGVALVSGAAVSALMEFGGLRGTLFFIPAGAWLGFVGLNRCFGFLGGFRFFKIQGETGVAFLTLAIIAAVFGALSLLGLVVGARSSEERV
ncbi:MAG: hypothetical protein H6707_06550 [Deltaproteobacteria bacterium]|nr:hypothetical protein [Deltaproteobacteria bacterium]